VEGNAWSAGIGVYFPSVQFDISVDRATYEYSEFLFNQVPPPGQPLAVVELKESLAQIYFSSTIRF
jgi:hypothetical protein